MCGQAMSKRVHRRKGGWALWFTACFLITLAAVVPAQSAHAVGPGCEALIEIGEPTESCIKSCQENFAEIGPKSKACETYYWNNCKTHGGTGPYCTFLEEKYKREEERFTNEERREQEKQREQQQKRLAELNEKLHAQFKVTISTYKLLSRRRPGSSELAVDISAPSTVTLVVKQGRHTVLRATATEPLNREVRWSCKHPDLAYTYTATDAIPEHVLEPGLGLLAQSITKTGRFKGVSKRYCRKLRREGF
jgi:hypothetical protein